MLSSFIVAALFAGVAMAHRYDYSGAGEVPVGGDDGYHVVASTAYSTAEVTITACDSTVKDCPLRSQTSVPVIETPYPSVPVSQPALPTSSATPEASSVEIPVEPHPSVPVVYSINVPVYPTAPSLPSPPFPIGTAPAGSACPVCPSPVTIYSTITSIPTEAPSSVPVPSIPIIPAPSVPIVPIESSPIPSGVSISSITYVPIPSGGAPAGTGASTGL